MNRAILAWTALFSILAILAPKCFAEPTEDEAKKTTARDVEFASDCLVNLELIAEGEKNNTEKLARALKAFQESEDIPATGKIDDLTFKRIALATVLFNLKEQGKVVQVQVPREGLREIRKMPLGTVFYMSKSNRFESLSEVKDAEFGCWESNMQYHLAVNVKFCRTSPWDKGYAIGNAHWENLFQARPHLKLFVTKAQYGSDRAICGTGGGLRIEFVLAEAKDKEIPPLLKRPPPS